MEGFRAQRWEQESASSRSKAGKASLGPLSALWDKMHLYILQAISCSCYSIFLLAQRWEQEPTSSRSKAGNIFLPRVFWFWNSNHYWHSLYNIQHRQQTGENTKNPITVQYGIEIQYITSWQYVKPGELSHGRLLPHFTHVCSLARM